MNSSYLVAVTNIHNLSDARYCAGMGAEVLGFCLSQDQADSMHPDAVKEIAGWVAGVKITGQFINDSTEEINELVRNCGLQLVMLHSTYLLDEISQITVPVILRVIINKDTDDADFTSLLRLYKNRVKHFLIASDDFTAIDDTNILFLTGLAEQFSILLGFGIQKENLISTLEKIKPAGIVLQGGKEIKPGLKNYDDLEEIFELLEN